MSSTKSTNPIPMSKQQKKAKEPIERMTHRHLCKYHGYGSCYKRSGMYGPVHILMGCDGSCRRMKIFDNKHGYAGQEFEIEF